MLDSCTPALEECAQLCFGLFAETYGMTLHREAEL